MRRRESENTLTTKQAAELMGVSEQCLRIGLQRGIYKFGVAMKLSSVYAYVIFKNKFEAETGIKIDSGKEQNT